jgi:TatD DNase family protein
MKLVDVHCHLEADEFKDGLDSLIEDARKAGVVKLVTASITPEQWPVSEALGRRYPEVAFAWGVHPWYLKDEYQPQLEGLRDARDHGAAAIGEIGLDGKIESPAMDVQRVFFEAQLRIARELDLPVVIHCRGAFNELIECLKKVGAPARGGLIHAFKGSVELVEELIKHRLRFSMGGSLTYHKNKKREQVLRRIYPDHFLLETDSPDIPPVQVQGQTNVPANILYNLRGAANYLGESEEDIAAVTTRNAAQLFGFDLEAGNNHGQG